MTVAKGNLVPLPVCVTAGRNSGKSETSKSAGKDARPWLYHCGRIRFNLQGPNL